MRVVGFGSNSCLSKLIAASGISGHCLVGLATSLLSLDSFDARSFWHRVFRSRGRVTGREVSNLSEKSTDLSVTSGGQNSSVGSGPGLLS